MFLKNLSKVIYLDITVKAVTAGICVTVKASICVTVKPVTAGICVTVKASICVTVKAVTAGICVAVKACKVGICIMYSITVKAVTAGTHCLLTTCRTFKRQFIMSKLKFYICFLDSKCSIESSLFI